jgi:hypothetical protein
MTIINASFAVCIFHYTKILADNREKAVGYRRVNGLVCQIDGMLFEISLLLI